MDRLCQTCSVELMEKNTAKKKRKCKSCDAKNSKLRKLTIKQEVMRTYGNKCVCCEEDNLIFLTIDHIDGNGADERRSLGGKSIGSAIYSHIKKLGYPKDNYQILCFNCNFAKHVLGTCPHSLKKKRN